MKYQLDLFTNFSTLMCLQYTIIFCTVFSLDRYSLMCVYLNTAFHSNFTSIWFYTSYVGTLLNMDVPVVVRMG